MEHAVLPHSCLYQRNKQRTQVMKIKCQTGSLVARRSRQWTSSRLTEAVIACDNNTPLGQMVYIVQDGKTFPCYGVSSSWLMVSLVCRTYRVLLNCQKVRRVCCLAADDLPAHSNDHPCRRCQGDVMLCTQSESLKMHESSVWVVPLHGSPRTTLIVLVLCRSSLFATSSEGCQKPKAGAIKTNHVSMVVSVGASASCKSVARQS